MLNVNTLYVTQDGAFLRKHGESIVVEVAGECRLLMPYRHLAGVVCLGRATASAELLAALAEGGVHVSFFSSTGRFLARVEGVPGGNVLLRREQFRTSENPGPRLAIARGMVVGKIVNSKRFLMHARRDASPSAAQLLEHTAGRLSLHLRAAAAATTLDELRGCEGIAAREYFQSFPALLKHHHVEFAINGRSRRPPRDRINALLSFGYALLYQDCSGACSGVGLDPAVGFLHDDRPGRLSLALDLMEELRAPVVDRLVVALINRQQIGPRDVQQQPSGGWRLTDEARRSFIVAYQEAKQPEIHHELLGENVPWGRIPHLQALLLARHLRGDIDAYAPFTIR